MRDLVSRQFSGIFVLAALSGVLLGPIAFSAQSRQSLPQPSYAPPTTPGGEPDLQGIWQVQNSAAWNLEDHAGATGIPAGKSVVEGGSIPYQPWALAKRKENFANRKTA